MIRKENQDVVYRTEDEKFRNAAKEIKAFQERGQPVLVGTISVEKSERLAALLKKNGVRHEVLNAKNHEREAHIVAQAGRKGSVTVSTNMAGRGTDILLGGNPESMARDVMRKQGKDPDREEFKADWERTLDEVKAACLVEHDEVVALGGLHIVGTERHDSRRIDNQLRGRAGRQGDPGSSRFFLSLQDDLLRIFGGERMQNLMLRLGMEEDVPIESNLITKRIAAAQKAVEAQNFESRKHLLEYDDVMNKQRQAVYGMRRGLLEGVDQKERVLEMTKGVVGGIVDTRCPTNAHPENYDLAGLQTDMLTQFGVRINPADLAGMNGDQIEVEIYERAQAAYQAKEDLVGASLMREAERNIMLHVIDDQWKDHLLSMDHLKEGIGLRGYGQKDPLVEYKKESYTLFQDMMDRIEDETVRYLYFLRFEQNPGALPFANDDSEYEEDEEIAERKKIEVSKALEEQQRLAAQSAVQDMTRGIQKQHERELKELQFAGTNGSDGESDGRQRRPESRAQRSLPLRQRQEIQEVPRSMKLTHELQCMKYCCCSRCIAAERSAAILPDTIGDWKKGEATPAAVPDQKVWQRIRAAGFRDRGLCRRAPENTRFPPTGSPTPPARSRRSIRFARPMQSQST